jgi:hypothetical protein
VLDIIQSKYQCAVTAPAPSSKHYAFRLLGIGVKYCAKEGTCFIPQQELVDDIIVKFPVSGRPVSSPLDFSTASGIQGVSNAEGPVNAANYRSFVGKLMHLHCCSRYDLSYAVNYFSRTVSAPTSFNFAQATRTLRYLKQTRNFSLNLSGANEKLRLRAYSGADWASQLYNRRSVSGTCITLGSRVAFWRSCVQKSTALSSCECEFIAASETCKEVVFRKRLF